jgi:CheY-like chemotaxis protein
MISNKRCFVVMPFSKTSNEHTTEYWNTFFSNFIKPTVEKLGYSCRRSNAQPGSIINGLIKELVYADLVLAVLTDFNPNVWYELGIRHASKNGTIMMIEEGQKLPFDISQYGVIMYNDKITGAAVFEKNLSDFIQKIESEKPADSPASGFLTISKSETQEQKGLEKIYQDKLDKIYQFIKEFQGDRDASSKPKETKRHLRSVNILWVDDEPSNNESIMDIYRFQGVKFDLAISTAQALEKLTGNDYDLVISDMGRGSEPDAGLRLLKEINEKIINPPPVFIFSSFKAKTKFGQRAKDEGAALVTSSLRELTLELNNILHLGSPAQ